MPAERVTRCRYITEIHPREGLPITRAPEAPLDPELALPDPNGEPCSPPGSEFECPFLKVCRPFTPTQGRCESCAPCGNLNAFCTQTSECDILFTCFRGRCTGFCELGSFNCGPPDACIDVGLSNMHGICEPR